MLLDMNAVNAAVGTVINGVDNPNVLSVDSTEPLKTEVDAEKAKQVAEGSEVVAPATDKKDEEEKVDKSKEAVDAKKTDKDLADTDNKSAEDKSKASKDLKKDLDDEEKLPVSVQKRIDKLTKIRRSQEREIAYKDQKLQQLEEKVAVLEGKVSVGEKPRKEDFENEDEYIEALTDYKIKQALAPTVKKLDSKEADEKIKEEIDSQVEGLGEVLADGEDKYDDFKEVVTGKFPLTKETVEAVIESEVAADLLYYIGSNIDVAEKLAGLTGRGLLRELGKVEKELEYALSKKPNAEKADSNLEKDDEPKPEINKKISNAPPPIKPVKANAAVSVDPNKMSMKEYIAWRKQGG